MSMLRLISKFSMQSIAGIRLKHNFQICYGDGPKAGRRPGMIRLARAADADAIAKIYHPIVSGTAISFELAMPTVAEMERRIVSTASFAPWLVYASPDEQVLGYAYASKHRDRAAYQWSVDVTVYIDEAHRRQG